MNIFCFHAVQTISVCFYISIVSLCPLFMGSFVIILYLLYFLTTLEIYEEKKRISLVLLPDIENNLPKGRNPGDTL
jgi:hypothetical protein